MEAVRNIMIKEIGNKARFFIIPQVVKHWEDNHQTVKDVLSGLSAKQLKNVIVLEKDHNIYQLLKIYNNMDYVLAMRMHSAIFSVMVNTPFVAISYDYGAKWDILGDMGLRQYICPINELNVDWLEKKVDNIEEQRLIIQEFSSQKVLLYPLELQKFMESGVI